MRHKCTQAVSAQDGEFVDNMFYQPPDLAVTFAFVTKE